MKMLRHMMTALAAQIPCKLQPQAVPAIACDCADRFAVEARRWDEGLLRHMRRVGSHRYSTVIGNA